MPRPEASMGLVVQELVRRSNEEARRTRDLEQRVETLENRMATLEQLLLERFKKIEQRDSSIEAKLHEMDESILKLRAAVDRITRQLANAATKSEVQELGRAFELMQPEFPTLKVVE